METPLIEFRNITKNLGGRNVLNGINFRIFEGQITVLIGKSGSGKSVLLKHIVGLIKPDSGEIFFRGKSIWNAYGTGWDKGLSHISYMFQSNALFDSMTVYENIALPLNQTTRLSKLEIEAKVKAKAEQTELAGELSKYPSELSGGMQKRVALARALVTDPEIVLFDEPTTGQDLVRKNAILGMIAEYQKKIGFSAIIISHDIPDVFNIANRVLVLYEGKIVFQDSPEALYGFKHPFMSEYAQSIKDFKETSCGESSIDNLRQSRQTAEIHKEGNKYYVICLFNLEGIDSSSGEKGHPLGVSITKLVSDLINKHFDVESGFHARKNKNQFISIFPFSEMDSVSLMMEGFVSDLQKVTDYRNDTEHKTWEATPKCTLSASLVVYAPGDEIDNVLKRAESDFIEIANFPYKMKRK